MSNQSLVLALQIDQGHERDSMASDKESTVQECEDYIEKHGIQSILKDCIAKLCHERPANPYRFLREYFEKQEKVVYNNKTETLLTSSFTHSLCLTNSAGVHRSTRPKTIMISSFRHQTLQEEEEWLSARAS